MKFSRGVTLQLNFATTNRVIVPILNGLKRAGGVYNSATGHLTSLAWAELVMHPIATNIKASVTGSTPALSWPARHGLVD